MSENNNLNNENNLNVEPENGPPPALGIENMNNNQQMENHYYNANNSKKCCTCSEKTLFWLRIFFCPFFLIYNTFQCFCDDRCQREPYYHSGLFLDNVVFCIVSFIELVIISIFKEKSKSVLFIIRIISDCLGIIVCWLALALWSEEATDEDHMDPACCSCTSFQHIITIGLDISSLVILIKAFSELNTTFFYIFLILIIIHLLTPIICISVLCCHGRGDS